ncbi:hypothetical protein A0H81_11243 [Grifola frondosa]|uniref:DUF6699 domain-containing protein n=1 Tax=Grifola frondosa TaxID=5627 RepID=A0A1C7LVU1_GRIFR|nr:hypothetical protein A0H81_11243 [Grifola frondosa]
MPLLSPLTSLARRFLVRGPLDKTATTSDHLFTSYSPYIPLLHRPHTSSFLVEERNRLHPPAPRIGRIELPDVETPVVLDYRKAQLSNGWSSDSESSNSPSTPSTPWLKQPMPGPGHTKWGSRSSTPQPAHDRPSTPKLEVLKPKPRRDICKDSEIRSPIYKASEGYPETFTSFAAATHHTTLAALAVSSSDIEEEVALKKSDLEKAASDQQIQPLAKMTICYVFDSIYKEFNHALTNEERERYFSNSKGRLARCEAAFKKRCEDETTVVAAAELAKGMRRVDLLEGRTIFMGLRRPHDSDDKPNTYWVLELGYPPCDDKARR